MYKLKGFFLENDDWYRIDHTWMFGVGLPELYFTVVDIASNTYPEA